MTDISFKPDPNSKGSYFRRIEDINRALAALEIDKLPAAAKFLGYFFGCEKLAQAIVGIHAGLAAIDQYKSSNRLNLAKIKIAAASINLKIPASDLDLLFADHREQSLLPHGTASARVLRNTLTHDFGPTNVRNLGDHSSVLIPKMLCFLACIPDVTAYLKRNFSHVT